MQVLDACSNGVSRLDFLALRGLLVAAGKDFTQADGEVLECNEWLRAAVVLVRRSDELDQVRLVQAKKEGGAPRAGTCRGTWAP